MSAWRAVATADGSATLAHPVHGETCHSTSGAWQQARERYARGCRLSERGDLAEIRVLDVGTGLGLNLAAALEAAPVRLRVVSLENRRDVLEAGLALSQPPEVERWLAPVRVALARGLEGEREVSLGRGTLRLLVGDARETLPALEDDLRFDAVFLDPFSPRVDPPLWEPGFLAEVARRMAPGSWLSTYTASMRVRTAFASAGLRVGPGPRVGTKASGTLASPDQDPGEFDARTARRLRRTVHASKTPGGTRARGGDSVQSRDSRGRCP